LNVCLDVDRIADPAPDQCELQVAQIPDLRLAAVDRRLNNHALHLGEFH